MIESNPALNFHFDHRDVDVTAYSKGKNKGTELVEIRHQSLSKLYQFNFENISEKLGFVIQAGIREYPPRSASGKFSSGAQLGPD